MSDQTKIEWADSTWNPIVGCTKLSPGCANCYGEGFGRRQHISPSYLPGEAVIRCLPERLGIPGRWRRGRRVFVCSLSDLFHDDVPADFIAHVFQVMASARQHRFMVLTKRPGRMERLLSGGWCWACGSDTCEGRLECADPSPVVHFGLGKGDDPLPNIELGVSIENQHWADRRLPHLIATPAARRFVSYEPALGAVDLGRWLNPMDWGHETGGPQGWQPDPPPFDLVICGGESGPQARPMHPDWPRQVRDQCVAAGVGFMFKQWGRYAPVWSTKSGTLWIHPTGKTRTDLTIGDKATDDNWQPMTPLGKKLAGAVLDGREWPLQRPDGI